MTRSAPFFSQFKASSQQTTPSSTPREAASSAAAISTILKSKAKSTKSQIDVLEHHDDATLSPEMLHGLHGIFKNPDNLVHRLIVALEAISCANPSPFEPDGEIYWLLLADALKITGDLFTNLESYDLVRTVVAKMAHIQHSPERLDSARERVERGRKAANGAERVDELLWKLLLLRTQQEKRGATTPTPDSVLAASLPLPAPATQPTNEVVIEMTTSQEKMVSRSGSVSSPRLDSHPAVSSQTPITLSTNEKSVPTSESPEKTTPLRNNCQLGPRDHEQQDTNLEGKEQCPKGIRSSCSRASEVVESRIVDGQEQELSIAEKILAPQITMNYNKEGEMFEGRAADHQEQPMSVLEPQKNAAQQQAVKPVLASQKYQLRSPALAPARHRPGHAGKHQEHEQRSLHLRLSSQGNVFVSSSPSYSLPDQEASSVTSANISRKREASSSLSTPFSSPPLQYPRGNINVSQSIQTILETVNPDAVVIDEEGPPAKRARWPSVSMQTCSFYAKDEARTDLDPKDLGLTSGATNYPYQQLVVASNEPTKITCAPAKQESDEPLQNHMRQSQEKLDHFLQHVADQGAFRDGQVSNIARNISHLKSKMEAMTNDFTALRATNTMVIQSMSMLIEENQRLRETVKELIGKLDS